MLEKEGCKKHVFYIVSIRNLFYDGEAFVMQPDSEAQRIVAADRDEGADTFLLEDFENVRRVIVGIFVDLMPLRRVLQEFGNDVSLDALRVGSGSMQERSAGPVDLADFVFGDFEDQRMRLRVVKIIF